LPYRLSEVAPNAPIFSYRNRVIADGGIVEGEDFVINPEVNTTYDVKVYYDTADSLLKWDVQEEGKILTLTPGTHNYLGSAEVILCDTTAGSVQINLPDPTTNKGRRYIFKKTGIPHSVTITGTIDDNGEVEFNSKNESVTIVSDGTQYWLIAQYH